MKLPMSRPLPRVRANPCENRPPRSNFWCTGGIYPFQMIAVKNNLPTSNDFGIQRSRGDVDPRARPRVDTQNPNISPRIDRAEHPMCRGVHALHYRRSGWARGGSVWLLCVVSSPRNKSAGRVVFGVTCRNKPSALNGPGYPHTGR